METNLGNRRPPSAESGRTKEGTEKRHQDSQVLNAEVNRDKEGMQRVLILGGTGRQKPACGKLKPRSWGSRWLGRHTPSEDRGPCHRTPPSSHQVPVAPPHPLTRACHFWTSSLQDLPLFPTIWTGGLIGSQGVCKEREQHCRQPRCGGPPSHSAATFWLS